MNVTAWTGACVKGMLREDILRPFVYAMMHLPHHDVHFKFAKFFLVSFVYFGSGIISLNVPTYAIKANKDISI